MYYYSMASSYYVILITVVVKLCVQGQVTRYKLFNDHEGEHAPALREHKQTSTEGTSTN